ncbi:MAG: ABC transporter ATP-binding protein [Elusimicrobia bacterium]|nr:ABC transporter ATP-binding protein [Elusimicrobiota bacterium]
MSLELKNVSYRYDGFAAASRVTLSVQEGEFLAVLGPSGCGKTTLLKIIAGLIAPQEGKVFWRNNDITKAAPQDRDFSLVFQNYALLPHLTVFDNVAFPLAAKRYRRERSVAQKLRRLWIKPSQSLDQEESRQVYAALKLTRLEGYGLRAVGSLSGGEAQRVALARSLVTKPTVLLMDEPLANLDRQLKIQLREELKRIHRELGITFIYVTHDQEEAVVLAQKIALFNKGVLVQTGVPGELLRRPATEWAGQFFNANNIVNPQVLRILPNQ